MYIGKNGGRLAEESSPVPGLQGNLEYAQYLVGGRIFYIDLSAFIKHLFLIHTQTPDNSQEYCNSQPQYVYPNGYSQAACW